MKENINNELNKQTPDPIIGEEEIFILDDSEFMVDDDSIEIEYEIPNSPNMKLNLTPAEIARIKDLCAAFNESNDQKKSLAENLKNFYLTQMLGSYPDKAESVTNGIIKGVEMFQENLNEILKNGDVDYMTKLDEVTSQLSKEEQYAVYLNLLAALTELEVKNFDMKQIDEIPDFETLKKQFEISGEITDEALADIKEEIEYAINNNSLCLASIEGLDSLIDVLPGGEEAVTSFISTNRADIDAKCIVSMATYIAYLKDGVPSLENTNVTPESLAVAIAAGQEEAKILGEVINGSKTFDVALKYLMAIGKAVLWSVLTLLAAYISLGAIKLVSIPILHLLGTTTIGASISICVGFIAANLVYNELKEDRKTIMTTVGTWVATLTKYWKEKSWNTVKVDAIETVELIEEMERDKVVTEAEAKRNPASLPPVFA